jgi:hypothetical protein
MTMLRNAALVLALTGAAASTHAGVRASAVTALNLVTYSAAEVFVPLNDAGATTLSFNPGSSGKKVLTFSAECAVAAPAGSTSAWLDLDIYVNGVIVTPTTATSNAFCSSNGTASLDGWTRASITIPIQTISGTNTVRILARGGNGATGLWLGEPALVIYD